MDAKVPDHDQLRLYVEVAELDGITPQALLRDLQLGLPRMNYLTRIAKLAVVSGSEALPRRNPGLRGWTRACSGPRTSRGTLDH